MKCTNGLRHWFTRYGHVGERTERCQHCGAPNPNWRPPTFRCLYCAKIRPWSEKVDCPERNSDSEKFRYCSPV
jgi:hypothetical protein